MNDRFKFRAYYYNDVFNEWMVYENPEFITGDGTCRVFDNGEGGADEWRENVILCQCTGLKDKNGKLIYEGDIVKNNQNSLYSVEFEEFEHQTKFCLKRIENPNYYPHISTWQGIGYKDQKNYEVIGNIYENKELLQERTV